MVGERLRMSVKLLRHKDINRAELEKIAFIKEQHWTHGLESQIKWIDKQFVGDDCHVILCQENEIMAYVGMNRVKCMIDGIEFFMWGIGNVCVDKEHQGAGLGFEVMKSVNDYLENTSQIGVLLCHDKLCKFYCKVGWHVLCYKKATVNDSAFNESVMMYNTKYKHVHRIDFNKNF